MKRKFISLTVVMAMLLMYAPIATHAEITESGTCGENATWMLDDEGTLTISGTGDMENYQSNYNVPWKEEKKTSIINVVVEEGVTSIGKNAFCYCDNLESVRIPQSVSKIGDDALCYCGNLSAIEVDKNNESYMSEGGVLFNKAQTELICYPPQKENTSYAIPDSVTAIGWCAFSKCKNLESINIPDSVTSIGGYAFEECSNLLSLTIPDGVTEIQYGMAVNCEKLASIKFPDSITIIASYVIDDTAYYNDESNWIDNVLYVDNCLMEINESLSGNYQIKDGTVTIGDDAFYCGDKVTGVSIPESVKNIGMDAFYGTAFYKDDSNWTDNVLYIDNCLIDIKKKLSGDYQIKDGTRLIADYAFYNSDDITSITIPKSVTRIGDEAFYIYNKEIDLIFTNPTAVKLYGRNVNKIYIHEGYTGYTSANGYDESKIVIEPHNYTDGVCSVCGAKKSIPVVTKTDTGFTVQLDESHENCVVYAAVYDEGGRLLRLSRTPLKTDSATDIAVDFTGGACAKVFVWTDTMQPVITETNEFVLV